MPTADLAPDFRSVIEDPKTFSELVERRQHLKDLIKECEAEIGYTDEKKVRHPGIDDEIERMLTDANAPKVQYSERQVSIVPGSRSSLSKERLVELGVPVTIVQQATKVTKFTYILVK